ncbi:MAG: alpha/beta fold hydrolase [Alphaproteobacteria bacterium]|nr:alpha/beta fold hydrolase [Alphaproteobacteria bacterium]
MSHYILVHGAWEGSWSWDYTRPTLEKQGHTVTVIDLHGSSGGTQSVTNITLESYVETVVKAINSLDHSVILVGHSMAGAVISQVAERLPEKIEKPIYVAAFLLNSGDSVIEAMQRDPDGEFLPELIFSKDQSSARATEQTWRSKAFHDVKEERILKALPLVDVAQATEPFIAKVMVSKEKFGSVPKVYIRTALDKMVSPKLQDEMLQNWSVDQVRILQSGHFPTLSMPETLAELML